LSKHSISRRKIVHDFCEWNLRALEFRSWTRL
jgi:hypothetical protein